jgi:hypothetical protein
MIMFRENSIHAIPKDEESSYPTPQETADVIENAAMHLFTLFGKETNIMMIILLILAGIGACGGGAAAYYGYQHDAMIKDIHSDVSTLQGSMANITGSGGTPTIIDNSGIPTVTPKPTGTIKPSATPGLPKV